MLKIYPAVYHTEDGKIICHFPDLPEVPAFSGEDKESVAEKAKEVLGRYYVKKSQDRETIPDPSNARLMQAEGDDVIEYVYPDITQYWDNTKAKEIWV